MTTNDSPAYRVRYVGTGRRTGRWGRSTQPERDWRQQLASEQEAVCEEMTLDGLRLAHVVPVLSSAEFRGGWTEGVWLYFTAAA